MKTEKLWKKWKKTLPALALIFAVLCGMISYVKLIIPDKIHVVVSEEEKTGIYTLKTTIFGIPCQKDIEVSVTDTAKVIPCGFPVGIYLETDGIMVVDSAKLTDIQGMTVEPCYGILHAGDYITQINGEEAKEKEDLIEAVNRGEGSVLILTVRKNGEESQVSVTPILTNDGTYKLGLWVRDDAQGIGTLTYLEADGGFGALGHGVSDVDTGELLNVSGGKLYETKILSVIKGAAGAPGGLSGVINYDESSVLGSIQENSAKGIYGMAPRLLSSYGEEDYVPIGLRQDVSLGKAYIRCQIANVVEEYEIEIIKLENSTYSGNKGMEIKVTDSRLLDKTNGIVQGMSGSPILQNGKLIGAVTHVFVQDSTRGYGILIEDMLAEAY